MQYHYANVFIVYFILTIWTSGPALCAYHWYILYFTDRGMCNLIISTIQCLVYFVLAFVLFYHILPKCC